MITTVTLNPAVDKTYSTAMLMPGQVNRMDSVKNIAGGKGINVAKVLRQYDYPVKAMGFIGGYTGAFIETVAGKLQMQCAFTHIEGETRTSINILGGDGYVTELLEPGPTILDEELQKFLKDYEKEIEDSSLVILSGSAPDQVPANIYRELIKLAERKNKKVLLDTSGDFLKEGAMERPFMIKPNIKELEIISGRRIRGLEECKEAAMSLHKEGISHVLVSMGAKGLLYVTDGRVLYAKAPKVKAVNTVGCGDCVVAAFAMGYEQNLKSDELLKLCVGISAANATTLENGIIPMDEAKILADKTEVIYG